MRASINAAPAAIACSTTLSAAADALACASFARCARLDTSVNGCGWTSAITVSDALASVAKTIGAMRPVGFRRGGDSPFVAAPVPVAMTVSVVAAVSVLVIARPPILEARPDPSDDLGFEIRGSVGADRDFPRKLVGPPPAVEMHATPRDPIALQVFVTQKLH